jgi:putative phosphoribosyl transferase
MRFHDRRTAGRELAVRLMAWATDDDLPGLVVLALPRGGVPVAAQVARAFGAPLDVLVSRKIGLPGQPETGIGAIAGDDAAVFDRRALGMLGLDEDRLEPYVARERTELRRRSLLYRGDESPPEVDGRTVILVDDGLATGSTARAALRHLRRLNAARLILAVPVSAPEAAADMRSEADDVVCLTQPSGFMAVGHWYDEFDQVSDDEVVETLRGNDASTPGS